MKKALKELCIIDSGRDLILNKGSTVYLNKAVAEANLKKYGFEVEYDVCEEISGELNQMWIRRSDNMRAVIRKIEIVTR
jgi:hypothetical protein